jgi:cytochrome c-type biogenesis protein CcmH
LECIDTRLRVEGDNLFWLYATALGLIAALFVILPVLRFHRSSDSIRSHRENTNLLIFKERLTELEAEFAAGLHEPENFQALKAELERSLLSDVSVAGEAAKVDEGKVTFLSRAKLTPLLMVLLVLPSSYYLYQQWGFQSELELAELYEQTRSGTGSPQETRDLIFTLGDVIQREPDNGWAWYFLAQNLVNIQQFPEAAMALERAGGLIEQAQDQAVVLGQHAFLEYMLAEQQITEQVQSLIDRVQRIDPNQLLILQILGMDAEMRSDHQSAITYWRRMLQQTPPGAEADMLQEMIVNAQNALAATDSPASNQSSDAVAGPSVEIALALGDGLQLPPGTRVFVSVLEVNGRGQPLAARLLTIEDLPTTVTLTDSDAVGPFNLSSAQNVYVVATASSTGSANVQSGDYQSRTEGFAHEGANQRVELTISELVP